MIQVSSVNIRPGVNVLSVLPHLNYKSWFALAEFVDNSIQSSIENKKKLKSVDGKNFKLRVDIDFNVPANTISIKDNAAGISSSDYQRAFRPAEIPPDATGLSEFGMGMKSAACWFAPNWSVRSSALGENVERTVIFNIDEIVHDSIEELNVLSMKVAEDKHYTEVRLENIRRFPRGKTIHKIKEHLSSIYRVYIRDGSLALFVDGEELKYEDPAILSAPSYRDPDGETVLWKKEIDFDLGDGKSATGFVAIRETASTRLAGLALFRRKRLIMGSADEAYRPEDIFGRSNTYPYQRIFGEIHLKGFFVSHTKDGIKWEESEDEFLRKLRKVLSEENFPLLQQAREHRTKASVKGIRKDATAALNATAANLRNATLSASDEVNDLFTHNSDSSQATPDQDETLPDLASADKEHAEFQLRFRGEPWIVGIELSYADDDTDWLTIQDHPSILDPEPRRVTVRVAMLHPFMAQFPTMDADSFTAILNIAAAMGLAEVVAAELADKKPTVIRRYTNEILKNQMSKRTMND
ncbi:ATP-binding protein [Psychromarinibacter halotolerans]|uniref:ATP-binding protein n=1 Tax=Psychromarinibacter halotolerans TaxID=1775175 RepID=A0ABV7GV99_9RHOB|nr:ATP-binding protein [Psychromarinibacter halotolerans]MDF0596316.1 ATP-binding protein [Psychromarinibacter halotolerans]